MYELVQTSQYKQKVTSLIQHINTPKGTFITVKINIDCNVDTLAINTLILTI